MEICNLTPDSIVLVDEQENLIDRYASRGIAECQTELRQVHIIDGVPIYQENLLKVTGLPDPDIDGQKYYIVTPNVAKAIGGMRIDLLVPMEQVQSSKFTESTYKRLLNL